jgi:glycosyltransferase involved in cell wall biosynthesis
MYHGKRVCVVVPCHNEETQITKVVETMPDFVDRVVIVDDKSTDRTVDVVQQLRERHPRIELLCHTRNEGVGGAIATGYKYARDHEYDIAVVMAGDAQMNPDDLPALLEPLVHGRADYSKGNRLVTGEAFKKIPKVRFFGNAALSLLTKIASGYWHIADSQSGYTAITLHALRTIDWDRMYKRYGQPNDLLVKLNVHNMRVVDVPVEPVYNVGEKSGIRIPKVLFTIGWLIMKLFFWRLKEKYVIRDFHPLILFYGFGILLLGISAALVMRVAILWYLRGTAPEMSAIATLFAFSVGFQSMLFAMWFDYQSNRHLAPVENAR